MRHFHLAKWTPVLLVIFYTSQLISQVEEVTDVSFPLANHDFIPEVFQPFSAKPPTLVLVTSDSTWNTHFVDPNLKRRAKVDSIRTEITSGLIDGTIVMQRMHQGVRLGPPSIMTMSWYTKHGLKQNQFVTLREHFTEKWTKPQRGKRKDSNASLRLITTQFGNTAVSLNIKGSINIDGKVIFQDQDQTTYSQRESKSWDLDVNQRQQFDITGNIGERLEILVSQNSEADFAWENNMMLKYRGKEDDIFQRGEAGNIGLSLPRTEFVNDGSSKTEGLFGIKTVHQLGPATITSIMSREQAKQGSSTYDGGKTSEDYEIKDYEFIKDRFFFVDNVFKNQYYPLIGAEMAHLVTSYKIIDYDVYKSSSTSPIHGKAYLDLDDPELYEKQLNWELLTRDEDYYLDPQLGMLHMAQAISSEALAIAYSVRTENDTLYFGDLDYQLGVSDDSEPVYASSITGTNVVYNADAGGWIDDVDGDGWTDEEILLEGYPEASYDEDEGVIYLDEDENGAWTQDEEGITLKLLKDSSASTAASKTWDLMLKNAYYLGATGIDPYSFELNIEWRNSATGNDTHTTAGRSFLNMLGLDSYTPEGQYVEGGDGLVDLKSSLVDFTSGILFFPAHMPFAYDSESFAYSLFAVDTLGTVDTAYHYMGSNDLELATYVDPLVDNDPDDGILYDEGPSMYYSTTTGDHQEDHEFNIMVKHSKGGASIKLDAFMIVEGSEEVRLNGRLLQRDIHYTIDYFTGNINFIDCEDCTDPTANLIVNYQENELISFDQKVLAGTAVEVDLSDNIQFGALAMYYNQSIIDEKVDVGYEPVRNFIWDINGSYTADNIDVLTRAVNSLPLIETNKPSRFSLEGEYAEVIPDPNPLGQAFLDDFESSKRTTAPSMMMRFWKEAATPIGKAVEQRGHLSWYNPYNDIPTQQIWPNQSVSTRANNTGTRVLVLEPGFQRDSLDYSIWNGVTTALYTSEYNQSESKYLDIWVNSEEVADDSLALHIDIGRISEDINGNGVLDSEDRKLVGSNIGDKILDEYEDIGLDVCTDAYEDGFGGCLCPEYEDESTICSDPDAYTYATAPAELINTGSWIDPADPNGDNWSYVQNSMEYEHINGTEGNGEMANFSYPDTEDLDGSNGLDDFNDYGSFTVYPKIDEPISATDHDNDGEANWKLYRVRLFEFLKPDGTLVDLEDVRNIRLWMDGATPGIESYLMIAKIELVANEWQEEGMASLEDFSFEADSTFNVAVANTDENSDYNSPEGVMGEYDGVNDVYTKEQSLVLEFELPDDGSEGGIPPNHIAAVNRNFENSGDENSFFVYNNMEMYVSGKRPEDSFPWFDDDSAYVQLVFQFGRDNNFYEIVKPIYSDVEWDDRNHLDIDLGELSQFKLGISSLDEQLTTQDTGLDTTGSAFEDGAGGRIENGYSWDTVYNLLIDEDTISDSLFRSALYVNDETGDSARIYGFDYWREVLGDSVRCASCNMDDPNGDDWDDCGTDGLCEGDFGWLAPDDDGSELNELWDSGEGLEGNGLFDFVDLNENGLHDLDEPHEFYEDYNGDGIFNEPPDNFDEEREVWEWFVEHDFTWEKIRVKGEPAINRIDYITIGVQNTGTENMYGKVLLDELRMTNVNAQKGRAMRIKGEISFADLMSISADYSNRDADFHGLRSRLGNGENSRKISLNTRLNPDKVFPASWGVKMPVSVNYSNDVKAPKYRQGTDILVGSFSEAPDSIKTISRSFSASTSLRKTTRSEHWWTRFTIDNITISNVSASYNYSSSVLTEKAESRTYRVAGKYDHTFESDNYWNPLKFASKMPLIGETMADTRLYWSPKNLSADISLEESNDIEKRRSGTYTENPSFRMTRKFMLNYQFTKGISSKYTKDLNSNMIKYYDDKMSALVQMSPGLITSNTESLNNTFQPDFMKWLKPKLTYNMKYNWSRTSQVDSVKTANMYSDVTAKFSANFNPRTMLETIYKPKGGASSSRPRRNNRRQSSSSSKYQVTNPVLVAILDPLYKVVSKISPVNVSYSRTTRHDYRNLEGKPDIRFKMGLNGSPGLPGSSDATLVTSADHKFTHDFSIKTGLTLINNMNINMNYSQNKSESIDDLNDQETVKNSLSFFPLGDDGTDGLPCFTWSVSWSGMQKYLWMDKFFKTVSLSHGYQGERNETWQEDQLQTRDYSRSFQPLFGFSAKTKGKNPVDINISLKNTMTVNHDASGTANKNEQSSVQGTVKYNHKGGLNLPIFFFRDFEIKNDTRFSLTLSYDNTVPSIKTSEADNFEDQNVSTSFSIKPDISYSFTKYVTGGFHFNYSFRNDDVSGKRTEKDIGFNIVIKIQG